MQRGETERECIIHGAERLTFDSLGDERGHLVALEEGKQIPFPIRRVFYIFDTLQGVARGQHAHKDLRQVLICLSGSCRILLKTTTDQKEIVLDHPNKGILVEPWVWHEMDQFAPNTVLVSLASAAYDENDYLRDLDSFLEYWTNKSS